MGHRLERFASTLRTALGEILGRESLDPGLRLITILRVEPSPDLKRAVVFVAAPPEDADTVLRQLQRASGFIKKLLANKMRLRTMPELEFRLDTALDLQRRLERMEREERKDEAADR